MKIIIIAAGWATRLGKETIDIPKGLLKITKKSIIEMQLDLFQENHLSDITIITGPNKDKFKFKNVNYIQNKGKKYGLSTNTNFWNPMWNYRPSVSIYLAIL